MAKITRRPWTQAELHYVHNNPENLDDLMLSKNLDRTVSAVTQMRRKLLSKKMPRWSRDEEQYVVKNHPHLTNEQMATSLGRSVGSISAKRRLLQLPTEKQSLQRVKVTGLGSTAKRWDEKVRRIFFG
jgi:hypothetical protein